MNTVLLFDADTVCHTVATHCAGYYDMGDGVCVSTFDKAEIESLVVASIRNTARHLHDVLGLSKSNKAHIVCALSAYGRRWREDVFPSYKRGRSNKPKPTGYGPARDVVQGTFDTVLEARLEGDDVLGLLATGRFADDLTVVVSIDKDLLQVPGRLFNPDHPERGILEVTRDSAHRQHMLQALMGDRTDEYPGCPGMGPVRAGRLLDAEEPSNWWGAIVQAYEDKDLDENFALSQARVARILVDDDYDWTTKEVKLWNPSS